MHIFWYGESCFKLQSPNTTVLIDPRSPKRAGLRGPNLKSDILLSSSLDKESEKKISLKTFLINEPGEYEIKGIFIEGISFIRRKKKLTLYRITFEEIVFGFLGQIDNLLSIEPKIIIPFCFKIPGLKIKRDPVEKFLKKSDKKNEPLEKYLLKKKDLLSDSFKEKIIILKTI